MQNPIEVIARYGVDTTSYLRAINQFCDSERPILLNQTGYENGIREIIGENRSFSFENEKEARIYFLYVVQETIRIFARGETLVMAEVWQEASRRAKTFTATNPWTIKEYLPEQTDEIEVVGEDGTVQRKPKQRKGAKKQMAESLYKEMNDGVNDRPTIIDALISEVGLTKAGATTYFHNLRKEFGFKGPKTEKPKRVKSIKPATEPKPKTPKKKGPSKSSIAEQVYLEMKGKPKAEILDEIVARSGTSKAGANTYYCSCKKKHGE